MNIVIPQRPGLLWQSHRESCMDKLNQYKYEVSALPELAYGFQGHACAILRAVEHITKTFGLRCCPACLSEKQEFHIQVSSIRGVQEGH